MSVNLATEWRLVTYFAVRLSADSRKFHPSRALMKSRDMRLSFREVIFLSSTNNWQKTRRRKSRWWIQSHITVRVAVFYIVNYGKHKRYRCRASISQHYKPIDIKLYHVIKVVVVNISNQGYIQHVCFKVHMIESHTLHIWLGWCIYLSFLNHIFQQTLFSVRGLRGSCLWPSPRKFVGVADPCGKAMCL